MERFATSSTNNVDKKGRVSIPASFRAALGGQSTLHALLSFDHPVIEVCSPAMQETYVRRLEAMDPLSQEYEDWSFYVLGNALELRLDSEGRIQLTDRIREQTGIDDKVVFEGRGQSFWLWEPARHEAYRTAAIERLRQMRRMSGSASGAPGSVASAQGGATAGRAGS